MPEKKKESNLSLFFIAVKSLSDLARSTYSPDGANSPLFLIERGGKSLLFSIGESISGTKMAYSFPTEKKGNMCIYTNKDLYNKESIEILSKYPEHLNYKSYVIPIIELDRKNINERKPGNKGVISIRAADYRPIVMELIDKTASSGNITNIYTFMHKGQRYLGSFDIIDSDDKKVFIHSPIDSEKDFKFLRYDQASSEIKPTDIYSEDISLSVINIEAPDFLLPE